MYSGLFNTLVTSLTLLTFRKMPPRTNKWRVGKRGKTPTSARGTTPSTTRANTPSTSRLDNATIKRVDTPTPASGYMLTSGVLRSVYIYH